MIENTYYTFKILSASLSVYYCSTKRFSINTHGLADLEIFGL